MPKRKLDDLEEDAPRADGADGKKKTKTLRAVRLEQKIEHGVVLLQRALKTARGFERQKLGRRQKTARSNKDDGQLRRLEQEVEALKTLDLHAAAGHYLIKQLVKTKRIAESPVFAQLDASKRTLPQDGPKEGPAANVTARLFNSNPVRDVLPGVMEGIRDVIGLPDAPAIKKPASTKPSQGAADSTVPDKGGRRAATEDVSMDEDDDFAQFDDRLASTESESESEPDDMDNPPQPATGKYDHAHDLSLSPTPSGSESESPPATSQKAPSKSTQPTHSTTYLPSLTMGGYWSGSEDSGMEDGGGGEAGQEPVRKNRMGQQARRKLWEKKYGTGANHVRKQEQQNNKRPGAGRDSGWDPRRGAIDGESSRGKRGKERARSQLAASSKSANDEPLGKPAGRQHAKTKLADQKPTHPSWDAAKRAKEQKSQASFQGKKIVFD